MAAHAQVCLGIKRVHPGARAPETALAQGCACSRKSAWLGVHAPTIACIECSPRPVHARKKVHAQAHVRTPRLGTIVPRPGALTPKPRARLELACAPKVDTRTLGPACTCPSPGARLPAHVVHAFCELHAFHSTCGVCYNDPEDLLQPLMIWSLIMKRSEGLLHSQISYKNPYLTKRKKIQKERETEIKPLRHIN